MSKNELILLGGGGHCKSCIDVIENTGLFTIKGILDIPSERNKKILSYSVIGNDDDVNTYVTKQCQFLVTIGQIKSSSPRRKLFDLLESQNAVVATVISPKAYVSPHAKIGKGSIVMHGAVVNAGAIVGDNCIINTSAIVEHPFSTSFG